MFIDILSFIKTIPFHLGNSFDTPVIRLILSFYFFRISILAKKAKFVSSWLINSEQSHRFVIGDITSFVAYEHVSGSNIF